MARYSAPGRTTNAPTATLPGASLYAVANLTPKVREIGIFNTTAVACTIAVARFTSAGTPGTGLVEAKFDPDSVAASATAFQSHTSTPPGLGDELFRADLGAAIGAGMVWTFDDQPLRIGQGTANGIGLISVGTGQIIDFYFIWDE